MASSVTLQPIKVSKETIKPSTPTSEHLRTYKLSLLDYINVPDHSDAIFFFAKKSSDDDKNPTIDDLKGSLSKLLCSYYPLAGRIKDKTTVICNDEGVEFIESHIACSLSDILQQPNLENIPHFLPDRTEFDSKSLLAVQATRFACGGTAIGVLLSNKIGDANSIANFMNDWASITQEPGIQVSPQFIGGSVLPLSRKMMIPLPQTLAKVASTTRRFVFEQVKIDALETEVMKGSLESLTDDCQDILAAFISKCICASFRSSGSRKRRGANYNMDLRTCIRPPLAANSIGNLNLPTIIPIEDKEMDSKIILGKFKACKEETEESYGTRNIGDDLSMHMFKNMLKLVRKFLFRPVEGFGIFRRAKLPYYDVDFGWGRPVWYVNIPPKDFTFLHKSTSGDGIEALISLDHKIMEILERDEELLAFASPNPSIVLN